MPDARDTIYALYHTWRILTGSLPDEDARWQDGLAKMKIGSVGFSAINQDTEDSMIGVWKLSME